MIEIDGLTIKRGIFLLNGVNLRVFAGEYLVILGPTGCGKTTLLEGIAGLYPLTSGRIRLNGRDVTQLPPEKRLIGLVYQDAALFPHLKVRDNIIFGLKARGLPKSLIKERLNEVTELIGIDNLLLRYPETLSGGEKRKVALARALILAPNILLLDEPLTGLDPPAQKYILAELKRLHQRIRSTTIHVTHNLEEARFLADRIGIMKDGQLLQIGEPVEIIENPKSDFVSNFLLSNLG